MTEIDDKSLLRCTLKKTLHTTERLFVYAAWLIVGGAIALCIAYVGYNGIPFVLSAIDILCKIVISALSTIPLLVYEIAAIPVAIIAYSFLWCIARELTDEDWKSGDADVAVVATAISAVVAIAVVAVVAAVVAVVAIAVATAVAAVVAVVAIAIAGDYDGSTTQKIFRFIGAAYHHYKQVKK